jgi:hypothetical protein
MYEQSSGNILTFLARAMEWHVTLAGLLLLGIFFPWAFVAFGIGLAYTFFYCAYCASQANLDVLIQTEGKPGWAKRLKWRSVIAWLNFLEPLARDWGRLKSGLTPWRSARSRPDAGRRMSPWWQRLQPFGRMAHWAIPGNMHLDKFPFLHALTAKLNDAGCAVGWNPDSADWDLKTRRGAMAEVYFRMVIEHHGGPNRLARLSAVIRPPKSSSWLVLILAAMAVTFAAFQLMVPAAAVFAVFVILWFLLAIQAGRLEEGVIGTCSEVAKELQGKRQ